MFSTPVFIFSYQSLLGCLFASIVSPAPHLNWCHFLWSLRFCPCVPKPSSLVAGPPLVIVVACISFPSRFYPYLGPHGLSPPYILCYCGRGTTGLAIIQCSPRLSAGLIYRLIHLLAVNGICVVGVRLCTGCVVAGICSKYNNTGPNDQHLTFNLLRTRNTERTNVGASLSALLAAGRWVEAAATKSRAEGASVTEGVIGSVCRAGLQQERREGPAGPFPTRLAMVAVPGGGGAKGRTRPLPAMHYRTPMKKPRGRLESSGGVRQRGLTPFLLLLESFLGWFSMISESASCPRRSCDPIAAGLARSLDGVEAKKHACGQAGNISPRQPRTQGEV
ncbi:hypothetical protein B0T26DRAFT_411505 [Lasiosphaeria miniovina]|uniref:Uncharacterized protein n=1 Tax=Lasiosphaeria miniovina TaxID=1954250 RepID=A0AA40DQC0_9PEZI|nr:uncharacterized protein B0T26DRAFT_411505 [Lasiosphaeria miniovina]KAK0709566.1 hypothetical protein B0T26DRAFT_411505 [Lasiosphaeria miniovina]